MNRTAIDEKDVVLRSIEKLRARAGHLHQELLELHDSAAFDPRLPVLDDRVVSIESETRSLSGEAEELRERLRRLRGRR